MYTTEAMPLMWRDVVARFQGDLARAGVERSDREVDWAIQSALVNHRDTQGWYTLPELAYADYHWDQIVEAVCDYLDLDYDEVYP